MFFFLNYLITHKKPVSFTLFKLFSADVSAKLDRRWWAMEDQLSVWYAVEHCLLVERIWALQTA